MRELQHSDWGTVEFIGTVAAGVIIAVRCLSSHSEGAVSILAILREAGALYIAIADEMLKLKNATNLLGMDEEASEDPSLRCALAR
jgi:hypothetical protein